MAADKLIPPLTNLLHSLAQASGWPEDLANSLSLSLSNGYELSVEYPDELVHQIENLEYGSFQGLPNAVIRPFIFRAPAYIKQIEEQIAVSVMMKDMGVL